MFRTFALATFSIAVFTAFVGNSARAELIGIGLDWRPGVFAQEYWEKGQPHYLLANLSDKPVEITLHEFDSKWRIGQPLAAAKAGPWKIPAGGKLIVDAKPLVGEQMWRWVVGGTTPIGVLPGPKGPPREEPGLITPLGLNGSGGFIPGVYLVQPKLEFAGGTTAKITLVIPGNVGVLKFKREAETSTDPKRPSSLAVSAAKSTTLAITTEEKKDAASNSYVVIDTTVMQKGAASHEVVLDVVLPQTKSPSLFMLDGWLANANGGGSGVTRGLWVVGP